eukprot:jgi/Psemu1/311011/fgenesh1_kg.708_\
MHFATTTTTTIFALAVLLVTPSPIAPHPTENHAEMAGPTAAPTTTSAHEFCFLDDPTYLYNDDPRKSCPWVATSLTERCKLRDPLTKLRVKRHCPSSCNPSCSCVDTTEQFFILAIQEWAKCSEVRKSECDKKVKLKKKRKKKLYEMCPRKCGTCYNYLVL